MNKVLNIGALVLDQKLQSRTEINEQTIEDYADAIKMGDEFPPVLAYFDGVHYYLTDGYHRYHAHKKAEKVSILCAVVNGTFRDAVLHATGVNAKHGMRRTHADKRKAVMTLLTTSSGVIGAMQRSPGSAASAPRSLPTCATPVALPR